MDAEMAVSVEDTDLKEDEKRANLRAHNVLEMGKFSYELEEKREQSLITQSGQMLTTFSIASAAMLLCLLFSHNLPVDSMTFPISVFNRKLFENPGVGKFSRFFYGSCQESFRCSNEEICCHNSGEIG